MLTASFYMHTNGEHTSHNFINFAKFASNCIFDFSLHLVSLTDLESSRDELLFELHKQQIQSPTDAKVRSTNPSKMIYLTATQLMVALQTIEQYFSELERLSEELGKQLWVILQRTTITIRTEPTIIVSCLRIIEREEKYDKTS